MRSARRKVMTSLLWSGVLAAACLVGSGCVGTATPTSAKTGRIEPISSMTQLNAIINHCTRPYVIVYHSPRCGFCSAMLKGIHRGLAGFGPQALIYTVDIDSNTDIRDSKGIGPVPVVVFYKDGREVNRWRTFRPAFVVQRAMTRFFAEG